LSKKNSTPNAKEHEKITNYYPNTCASISRKEGWFLIFFLQKKIKNPSLFSKAEIAESIEVEITSN
jgi:hypothetical protein